MEARVDIGEMDVVLIAPGQNARLEVDAFKDRKFTGTVSEIANSSTTSGLSGSAAAAASSAQQDATKFSVKIRIHEKEAFRPGMSVSAEIETRSRTNALTIPIASVTTRLPKEKPRDPKNPAGDDPPKTNSSAASTNTLASATNLVADTNLTKKAKEGKKPVEVVFLLDGDHAKMVPVKIGISDDSYWEVTEGLTEGQEIVSGGFRAISRDLEDGKKIKKGPAMGTEDQKKPEEK
jgi:HlyD family secretion protein